MRKPVSFLPHLRMQHGNGCKFAKLWRSFAQSWIDKHVVLGQQIIRRELELGMKPIQQGFSGYVPRELKEKYPEAKIRPQPSWCGFKGAAQLDPTDSLFR